MVFNQCTRLWIIDVCSMDCIIDERMIDGDIRIGIVGDCGVGKTTIVLKLINFLGESPEG